MTLLGEEYVMNILDEKQWSVGHGTLQGRSTHFSVNMALVSLLRAGTHPFEARFSVDIAAPNAGGLPSSDEELTALHVIEDFLVKHLESSGDSHLGVIVTVDGIRDYVFYSRKPDQIVRLFEEQVKPTATRHIELAVEKNDWKIFRLFSSAEKPNRVAGSD